MQRHLLLLAALLLSLTATARASVLGYDPKADPFVQYHAAIKEARAQNKLETLAIQHEDLSTALGELLSELFAGRKRLKLYRQLKMYNDPTLNPYLNGESQLRKAG